jgi:chemotaxis protein MotB
MDAHHPEIIIIKRKSNSEEGHHGGAWKIAFADFMTAMMAFFLVLWIINATDKDTKTIIARYFNPVKLENPARAEKGVHGVDSSAKNSADGSSGEKAPGAPPASTKDGKGSKEGKDAKSPPESGASLSPTGTDEKAAGAAKRPELPEPVDVRPNVSETALFSDPYQALDRIAGGRAALTPAPPPDTGAADPAREAGAASIEAFRDPFKPIGPGAANDPVSFDADSRLPPRPPETADLEPRKATEAKGRDDKSPQAATVTGPEAKVSEPKPDLTKTPENQATNEAPKSAPPPLTEAAAQLLKELRQKLGALAKSPSSPAIDVKATEEGLLISLTDRMTFSMFAIGSAEPRSEVVRAMEALAHTLKDRPGKIVLRGHTDGRAYKTATYDNWRLSSARAQMAYYMLIRGGIPEARIERVEGHADRALRDVAHPLAAENRRLEILLREPRT